MLDNNFIKYKIIVGMIEKIFIYLTGAQKLFLKSSIFNYKKVIKEY